jgi:hypothetical protein
MVLGDFEEADDRDQQSMPIVNFTSESQSDTRRYIRAPLAFGRVLILTPDQPKHSRPKIVNIELKPCLLRKWHCYPSPS